MAISVELLKNIDKAWWNSAVLASSGGNVYQLSGFAEYYAARFNAEPLFWVARDGSGKIAGQLLAFAISPFHDALLGRAGEKTLLGLGRGLAAQLEWFGGPVLANNASASEAMTALLLAAKDHATRKGFSRVWHVTAARNNPGITQENELECFRAAGFQPNEWGTLIVPLAASEEELWHKIDRSAHKQINKTKEMEVVLAKDAGEYAMYEDMIKDTCHLSDLPQLPVYPSFFMKEKLGDMVEVFLARENEQWLGGLGVFRCNGTITEVGVAFSERAFHERLPVQDRIKWEIIKWGKSTGCLRYDLAGVSPVPATQKEKGIRQFKEKWGGDYQPFQIYTQTLPSIMGKALALMQNIISRQH